MLTVTTTDGQTSTAQVTPDYRDIKRTWQRQNGHIYHNESLNGTVKFKDTDFDLIHGQSLYARFALAVYDKGVRVGRCEFRKTDCRFDVDHKLIELQLRVSDRYKKIEDNADKEINLAKQEGLAKRSLKMVVPALLQVYVKGDKNISIWRKSGKRYGYMTCVEHESIEELIKDSKFADVYTHNGTLQNVSVYLPNIIGVVYLEGFYYHTKNNSGYWNESVWSFVSYDTAANIATHRVAFYSDSRPSHVLYFINRFYVGTGYSECRWEEYENSTLRWQSEWEEYLETATVINVEMEWQNGAAVKYYMKGRVYFVFSRIISLNKITAPLPPSNWSPRDWALLQQDIYSTNRRYGQGWPYRNSLRISNQTSPTDLGYGKIPDTESYYAPPTESDEWTPVYQDSWWQGYSLWAPAMTFTSDIKRFNSVVTQKDMYTLGDVIQTVIGNIDSSVIFESDTDHSKFLFSNVNPLTQEQQKPMYVTQKSNVLSLEYDYPAWLAPIKWKQIETLLRNAFNCYWDIYTDEGGNKHLRIEHLAFYENGMSYDGATPAMLDLHGIYNSANEIPYSFRTDRWEWDKANAASTYQYGWMDNQSEIFNGHDIIIPEEYRLFSDDSKEERRVDWFSSDIDFLVVVPSECSSDGFAIVMEDLSRSGWIMQDFNNVYGGQNWRLSLTYMQPRYCIAGLYSPIVEIDGERISNGILARMRTAEVKFKIPEGRTITPLTVLFTDAGTGTIEKLEKDLNSDTFTATLTYPNE